ncbi:MAG TPA: ATP-binding protein [Mucilaginibacter sp.]|jgi:signal transduction histidine kinase|nr:ATP-binding protein [Mucilaginibacter sp.]
MRRLLVILLLLAAMGARAQQKYADSLKNLIRVAKNDTTKAQLIHQLCYAYTWTNPDSSIIYSRQSLQLARKINYTVGIADGLGSLCDAETVLGNYPQALDYGFKALSLYKKLNNIVGCIYQNSTLALCYRDQGDYKTSMVYVHNALNLAAINHIPDNKVLGLFGEICSVYEKNNQLDSALFYAIKSSEHRSGVLYVFGSIYAKKGDEKLALQYFGKTIADAEASNIQVDIVDAYNGIARLYTAKGEPDSAIYYSKKAIALKSGKTYPLGLLETTTMLADIYEKEHTPDSAYKYLKLTISLKDNLFSRQKERDVQNIAFNEQLNQQELEKQQEQAAIRLKMYVLICVLLIILIVTFLQWRNSRHRKQANLRLQEQKEEIEAALDQLQLTQKQLIQSEKMASLGELTAGIAHEIQNPLNFVNNFSEVNIELISEMQTELESGTKEEVIEILEDVKQNLEKISHHGKRADGIVKGMLQHSRASSNIKEPTDINKLADEYLRLTYHGLRAKDKTFNSELITHFADNLPKVNVVPQDIGRALLNLFTNAFYAVHQKQKKAMPNYQPTVTLSTGMIDALIVISVKDNGDGVSEDIREKIMQPFFTTKPTGEGTGLGLSLSYEIVVNGHGGTIEIDSKEGEYTEFIIKLPI